jgi:hypothetical protein
MINTTTSYPPSINSLTEYFQRHPLDTNKHSRQLIVDLGDIFKSQISIRTLVMAAVFSGNAVVPQEHGRVFRFFRVNE